MYVYAVMRQVESNCRVKRLSLKVNCPNYPLLTISPCRCACCMYVASTRLSAAWPSSDDATAPSPSPPLHHLVVVHAVCREHPLECRLAVL